MEAQKRLELLQEYLKRLVEETFDTPEERDTCYKALNLTQQIKYEDLKRYYLNGLDHFIQSIEGEKKLNDREKVFFENYYYLATIPIATMITDERNLDRLQTEIQSLKEANYRLKWNLIFLGTTFLMSSIIFYMQS